MLLSQHTAYPNQCWHNFNNYNTYLIQGNLNIELLLFLLKKKKIK